MTTEQNPFFAQFKQENSSQFNDAMICDLSHLGLMQVSGDDALDFLQGQLTNDLAEVTATHSQLSAYCTHKGRIQANFRICRYNDHFLLHMPTDILNRFIKRISMFIMRAKVNMQDVSSDLIRVGFAGTHIIDLLSQQFSQLPNHAGDTITQENLTLIRLPGNLPRFELIGEQNKVAPITQNMQENLHIMNQNLWELLDIRAGIPTVIADTFETFVPQMINMQLIDGVSFTKGCYIGQEVVARLKYLGKTKRQMYLAKVDTEECPQAGDKLFAEGSSSGQGAGNIVNVASSPDGGYELLVVSEITGVERDDVQLHNAQGAKLTFLAMPYDFEN